jgi:hypothetical protein
MTNAWSEKPAMKMTRMTGRDPCTVKVGVPAAYRLRETVICRFRRRQGHRQRSLQSLIMLGSELIRGKKRRLCLRAGARSAQKASVHPPRIGACRKQRSRSARKAFVRLLRKTVFLSLGRCQFADRAYLDADIGQCGLAACGDHFGDVTAAQIVYPEIVYPEIVPRAMQS